MNFANVFKTLGDETRLRLLNLFLQSGKKICVGEMVDALELPQYQISRHLTMLRNLDLVKTEREGTWIYYEANWEASQCVSDLFNVIKKHFKVRFPEDIERLNARLELREGDYCVIGHSIYEAKHKPKKMKEVKGKKSVKK